MRTVAALLFHPLLPCPRAVLWIVLAGTLFFSACTHAIGPKGLSESTYAATRKAFDALERANQSRDSGASVFDPKLQAASQAAEDVYFDIGNQSSDAYVASQIRSCIGQLKAYRSNFTSRESVSRPIEQQLKGLKATQMKDATDVVARDAAELDECVNAVKAYL